MSTIAQPGCEIQAIFAAFKRFGIIPTNCQNRPDYGQARNGSCITSRNYEIRRGQVMVLDQEDIDI